MKGVIFTEFIEMLELQQSPTFVDDLLDSSDLQSGGAYTAVGTYDARELTVLVQATAVRLGITEQQVFRDYGRVLFARLAALYPQFVEGHAGTFSFLERLSWLHYSEVVKLYPDGQVPEFEVTRGRDDGAVMTIVYRSPRYLGDLAEGLLRGVVDYFGESITITRDDLRPDGSLVQFTLTRSGGGQP